MEGYRYQDMSMIALTLLLAMLLTILPLPQWIVGWRPLWVLLVLIFWMVMEPGYVGIGVAFTAGLFMDLLLGTLLGQHAFTFCIVAYCVLKFQVKIRNFPLWQQTFVIMGLSFLALLLPYWIMGMVGRSTTSWQYWLPLLGSTLFWPWVYWVLQDYQQRYLNS